MTEISCLIWGTEAKSLFSSDKDDSWSVDCPRAGGKYKIDGEKTRSAVVQLADESKAKLTTWIVDQNRAGAESAVIDLDLLADVLTTPKLSVGERYSRFLLYLEQEKNEVAAAIKVAGDAGGEYGQIRDSILAWTESVSEGDNYYFIHSGIHVGDVEGLNETLRHSVRLSIKGHEKVANLKGRNIQSNQGFVAMWFDPSMEEIWEEGFCKGIEDAGFRPFRIDKKDHNNKIDDEIIAEIRRSRFVVADFTAQNILGADKQEYHVARGGVCPSSYKLGQTRS